MTPQKPLLILASQSRSRGALMTGAGLEFEQLSSRVDEDQVKNAMRAEGATTAEQAETLAEMKAIKVSSRKKGIVIGADQMLDLEGEAFDKPHNLEEARHNLMRLRGKTHTLENALVACENGLPVWRVVTRPKLSMRYFSESFLDDYLERVGEDAFATVGGYQLEGLGAQLFDKIEGDYFSILGLPLIQLLAWLRDRGIVPR